MKFTRPRPKHFLLFLLSLLVFVSCKKTDLSGTNKHAESFEKQFFETKTSPNDVVARVIALLKAENEKTGFVNKLPANCGLPVWEKLLVCPANQADKEFTFGRGTSHGPSVNTENYIEGEDSTIIIPLTISTVNLSSIMIIQVVNNTVSIDCYTVNGDLYDQTHGSNVDTTNAMNRLTLFFYMENRTYGDSIFYNIPSNLFTQQTVLDSNGNKTIIIKDDTTLSTTNYAPIGWICVEYQIQYECGASQIVPGSGICYSTYEVCTPIEGPGTGSGGGGSTGGGGGGGTGGGGSGPTGCNNPWYSFLNPCYENNPPPVNTDSLVKALLKKDNIDLKQKRDSVWNLAHGNDKEYHFYIKVIDGKSEALGIRTDNEPDAVSGDRVIRATGNPDGDYHTHQDHPGPLYRHPHDPQDVAEAAFSKKSYYRSYVDCGDTLYAVVIEDVTKVRNFFRSGPKTQLQESPPWTNIPNAGSNRRSIGVQALKDFLGTSSNSGFGLYKSTNADKTEFVKLN